MENKIRVQPDFLKQRQRETVHRASQRLLPLVDGRPTAWSVACESGQCSVAFHVVRRPLDTESNRFACDCPAGVHGLCCHHVLTVFRTEMRELGKRVAFWANEEDMRRQKRRPFRIVTEKQVVYVTVRSN